MKGAVATDTLVAIGIMLLIILILAIIAYFYIWGQFHEISLESYISQNCGEWVKEGCTKRSALPPDGIRIEVGTETKYLGELCVANYGGDVSNWESEFDSDPKYYENCKAFCMGCPE